MKKSKYVRVGVPINSEGENLKTMTVALKTRKGIIEWSASDSIEEFLAMMTWGVLELPYTRQGISSIMKGFYDNSTEEMRFDILKRLEDRLEVVYFDIEQPEKTFDVLKQLTLIPQGYLNYVSKEGVYQVVLGHKDVKVSEKAMMIWKQLQRGIDLQDILENLNLTHLEVNHLIYELVDERLVLLM